MDRIRTSLEVISCIVLETQAIENLRHYIFLVVSHLSKTALSHRTEVPFPPSFKYY